MTVRTTLAKTFKFRNLLRCARMALIVPVAILGSVSAASAQANDVDSAASLVAIIKVPERLERDVSAGALGVLSRHCARCHQSGRLERSAPAAGFDGILNLDELLRRPDLIVPGRPDASRLYQAMLTRHMPYDVFQDGKPGEAPSAGEIRQLRDWISGTVMPESCGKEPASRAPAVERIMEWVLRRTAGEVARTRFVTLAHLARGCGKDALAERYRAALLEAIYSASWSEDPASAVRPIDEARDVYAIDLDGLGWTAETWTVIAEADVESGSHVQRALPLGLIESTRTPWPVITGDLLAAALTTPQVYSQVMQFPDTRRVFEAVMGYRLGARGNPEFAYVEKSHQTGGARLAIRREYGRQGFAWWSFDAVQSGKAALSRMIAAYLAGEAAGAAGYQVLFRLPGGFLAAASFNSDGVRVGAQPELNSQAASDGTYSERLTDGGCRSCHSRGLVSGLEALDGQTRRVAANATHGGLLEPFSQSDLDARLDSDRLALVAARRRAGLPEDYLDGGIGGLAREYRVPMDVVRVAAEMGMPIKKLKSRLANVQGPMMPVARRLEQGLVTRTEFGALTRELAQRDSVASDAGINGARAAGAVVRAEGTGPSVGLSIWADRRAYKVGDAARLFAAADRDCNLTLINVDQAGQATVLYPSEFHPENAIKAGEIVQVPGPDAGYLLTFSEAGSEQFVGICMEGDRPFPPGIRINYERQRFTLLGEWHSHLDTYLAADAKERANVGKKKRKLRARWRRRGYQPPARKTRLPLPQLRSAITVEISK